MKIVSLLHIAYSLFQKFPPHHMCLCSSMLGLWMNADSASDGAVVEEQKVRCAGAFE